MFVAEFLTFAEKIDFSKLGGEVLDGFLQSLLNLLVLEAYIGSLGPWRRRGDLGPIVVGDVSEIPWAVFAAAYPVQAEVAGHSIEPRLPGVLGDLMEVAVEGEEGVLGNVFGPLRVGAEDPSGEALEGAGELAYRALVGGQDQRI